MEVVVASPLTPEELCSRYASAVCRFAAILAQEPADAEDLAQETLVKAIRALPTFDSRRGDIEAWLWRIAVNTSRDARRAGLRRQLLWKRLLRAPVHPSDSPETSAIRGLESGRVRAALRGLTGRERALLALRFGADLDYRAVGRAVGVSEDGARKATERSLQRLRAILEVQA